MTMVRYVKGNIFDSRASVLVNPVNTVGVMGAGLAKQFSAKYVNLEQAYKNRIRFGTPKFSPGDIFAWSEDGAKVILCVATKEHWKDDSKLEWVTKGLESIRDYVSCTGLKVVAIPPLGCGLGNLNWDDVKREIETVFASADFIVEVYEPR